MLDIVENFLKQHDLTSSDKTFLVGFSGGCDSLCLLDILHHFSKVYGFNLVALHLNHNWRGEESDAEELNCKNFCEKSGIEFISEKLSNGSTQKNENFAREARYSFFLKHAKKIQNAAIFTAHTKTDNVETIIYRIIKGTGFRGLQGIPPSRAMDEIWVYRPLLSVSRKKIEDYCNCKGLAANSDSSNFDMNFKRNYIRHKIVPLFDEINFHAENSINSLAKMAVSQSNIVDEYMEIIRQDITDADKFLTQKFIKLSDDVKRKLIYDACIRKDLDYDSKKIEINQEGKWPFSENKAFSLQKYNGDEDVVFPGENAPYALVNLDDVGLNLTIRTRREGDYLVPFGMSGKMKLKKYLNSKGVSQHEKDGILLLCKDSEVLWVAKVGLSNKLKVVNRPTHVLKLEDRL